jgi:hypothetical protein
MKATVLIAMLVIGLASGYAQANEQITHLANSGDWRAFFTDNDGKNRRCILMEETAFLSFQYQRHIAMMSMGDKDWSLPKYVTGPVIISIEKWSTSLKITTNDDTHLIFIMDWDVLLKIFDAMANGSTMTVNLGHSAPRPVSLDGSKEPIRAFLKCVGLPDIGSNPFE